MYGRENGAGRFKWRRSIGASPLTMREAAALNLSGSAKGSTETNVTNTDWLGNADYTFLMGCDLIESCRSLNGEIWLENGDTEHLQSLVDVSVPKNCQKKDAKVPTPGNNFIFRLPQSFYLLLSLLLAMLRSVFK